MPKKKSAEPPVEIQKVTGLLWTATAIVLCVASVLVAFDADQTLKDIVYLAIAIQGLFALTTASNAPRLRYTSLAIRQFALVISFLLLGTRNPLVKVLLFAPYMVDTVFYLHVWQLPFFVCAPLVVQALGSVAAAGFSGSVAAETIVVEAAGAACLGFGLLLSHYREALVMAGMRNASLLRWVDNLTASNVAFQEYANTVSIKSEIEERARITRELHDTVGYALTNIAMMLRAAKILVSSDPDQLPELLDRAKDQTNEALDESRRILHGLRDVDRPSRSGIPALIHLTRTYSEAMGIDVELAYGDFPVSLGEDIDNAVYRFVQEGLTNAFRHGNADKVVIHCQKTPTEIQIKIDDNGQGFGAAGTETDGIGISGMRERFAPFAGTVTAWHKEWGFSLSVSIPIQEVFHEDSGER